MHVHMQRVLVGIHNVHCKLMLVHSDPIKALTSAQHPSLGICSSASIQYPLKTVYSVYKCKASNSVGRAMAGIHISLIGHTIQRMLHQSVSSQHCIVLRQMSMHVWCNANLKFEFLTYIVHIPSLFLKLKARRLHVPTQYMLGWLCLLLKGIRRQA